MPFSYTIRLLPIAYGLFSGTTISIVLAVIMSFFTRESTRKLAFSPTSRLLVMAMASILGLSTPIVKSLPSKLSPTLSVLQPSPTLLTLEMLTGRATFSTSSSPSFAYLFPCRTVRFLFSFSQMRYENSCSNVVKTNKRAKRIKSYEARHYTNTKPYGWLWSNSSSYFFGNCSYFFTSARN